ncbi:MAG: hypothetical protein H6625_10855 [Bdellovibrionaceae bacterium]|nr:hypothetical protein [Pseudobdellovibrionaceae bacterium]
MALKKKDYESFEIARSKLLENQLQESLEKRKTGRAHSLRHTILLHIVEGDYDKAKEVLRNYIALQKEYPTFEKRSKRYLDHCFDTIQAIKTKRDFPGKHALPLSKQQELMEKVIQHFEELKLYLNRVEITQKDVKLDDLRSTVWVIKAIAYSSFIIVFVYFLRSAAINMMQSFDYVVNDYTNSFINWLFNLF